MNASQPPVDRSSSALLDLVIGINADTCGALLGDQLFRHRLAGIAVLHADHQAGKIVDAAHLRMPRRVDHQRLSGHRVGCDKNRRALRASGRDGRAGCDAVIGAGLKPGEDAVEVGTLVAHELPRQSELAGDAPHQRDVETRGPLCLMNSNGGSGSAAPHLQRVACQRRSREAAPPAASAGKAAWRSRPVMVQPFASRGVSWSRCRCGALFAPR